MRARFGQSHLQLARLIVWLALSGLLLWYLRWGSEIISITSYYHIRRSVPYIWNTFHTGLPEIGNDAMLDLVYWAAIAVTVLGILALFWLALAPSQKERAEPDPDQSSI